MPDASLHTQLVYVELGLAVVTFVALIFISAPYGRHERSGWGPTMPARWAWVIMETPAVLWFALVFAFSRHATEVVPLIFLGLWQVHYVYRTYVFPFRLRNTGKRMPVLVCAMAFAFQLLNGFVNARQVAHLGVYGLSWLADPRFIVGVAVFVTGWAINHHADHVLLNLRKPGETGYRIPRGGLYRWVSSPNYLGEILEWIGWAIATWSLAGLAFALYTFANLAPRARTNHQWYREKFPDYPPERKALVPGVW